MRVRIADDFGAIREAVLALHPKAPAIVHSGNLMSISSAHFGIERYPVTIEYPAMLSGALHRGSGVNNSFDSRVTGWPVSRETVVRTPSMPRMTVEQIDHWNRLRAHTGMRLRVVLQ